MKEQAITQRLKPLINQLENVANVERNQFGKKSAKSWNVGFETVESKPVHASAVYLYDLPMIGKQQPTFSITFDFYQQNSSYLKKALEEQTIKIGYCHDSNANSKNKDVFQSENLFLNDAKLIIKTITDKILEKGNSSETIFNIIEEVALNYKEANKESKVENVKRTLANPIQQVKKSIKELENANIESKKAKEEHKSEIEATNEYKAVQELEKQLKIARAELHTVQQASYKKLEVGIKNRNHLKLEREIEFVGIVFKGKVLDAFKDIELSHRHLPLFSEYFDLSPYSE
jgi:hypothetical protein